MDPVDSKWCGATVYAWAIWTEMKENNKEIATFKIAQELGGLELLDAKYEKQNFSDRKSTRLNSSHASNLSLHDALPI